MRALFCIEMIHLTKEAVFWSRSPMKPFHYREGREPALERRHYFDRASFEKDLEFLSRRWLYPSAPIKNARYLSVMPVDPTIGVVWC